MLKDESPEALILADMWGEERRSQVPAFWMGGTVLQVTEGVIAWKLNMSAHTCPHTNVYAILSC